MPESAFPKLVVPSARVTAQAPAYGFDLWRQSEPAPYARRVVGCGRPLPSTLAKSQDLPKRMPFEPGPLVSITPVMPMRPSALRTTPSNATDLGLLCPAESRDSGARGRPRDGALRSCRQGARASRARGAAQGRAISVRVSLCVLYEAAGGAQKRPPGCRATKCLSRSGFARLCTGRLSAPHDLRREPHAQRLV